MSMSLPRETLVKFAGRVFVETGTNNGDCVALALECGFAHVVSIELSGHYYMAARERFDGDSRVTLLHGDSGEILAEAIRNISEQITFWLDGHAIPGVAETTFGPCPLLSELDAISKHHIRTHTVLVDDVSCLGTPVLDDITVADVQAALLTINSAYEFSFERGRMDGDILAAVVRAT